jgi:hypothetical protein
MCPAWGFPSSRFQLGEGGIRTLGTLLEYGALAKRCFRPLSHLTNRLRGYGVAGCSSTCADLLQYRNIDFRYPTGSPQRVPSGGGQDACATRAATGTDLAAACSLLPARAWRSAQLPVSAASVSFSSASSRSPAHARRRCAGAARCRSAMASALLHNPFSICCSSVSKASKKKHNHLR